MPIDSLVRFLKGTPSGSDEAPASNERRLRLATATILLEIAYADDSISLTEETNIVSFLKSRFDLNDEEARDLLEGADDHRNKTIDHWDLTNVIKNSTTLPERIEIVKAMWRMVYADGHLHQYENYLVRKIADLLGLEHHVMIEAKLSVREESTSG